MNSSNDKRVATTKKAYDTIYKQYVASNPTLREDVRESLDYFISILEGKAVLDIGCAGGYESEYLYNHGLQVTGCDISEEFIGLAQERCPKCTFFVADMRHLDQSVMYDGIWANASFLHVPKGDALVTLRGFSGILREGGVLCISVMEGDFDGLRDNKDMNWPERHFSDYRQEEFESLLAQAGFRILKNGSSKKDWGRTFLIYFAQKG